MGLFSRDHRGIGSSSVRDKIRGRNRIPGYISGRNPEIPQGKHCRRCKMHAISLPAVKQEVLHKIRSRRIVLRIQVIIRLPVQQMDQVQGTGINIIPANLLSLQICRHPGQFFIRIFQEIVVDIPAVMLLRLRQLSRQYIPSAEAGQKIILKPILIALPDYTSVAMHLKFLCQQCSVRINTIISPASQFFHLDISG